MKADEAARPTGPRSQTIDRAALILTCFSEAEPTLTLAELSDRLGLNQSTVYRYVATLQSAGLLVRNPRGPGYQLGLKIIELAGIVLNQIEVRREAIPEMDRLRDERQLLVNLAVLDMDAGDIIHIAHSAPQGWPPHATTPGRRSVATGTALGKSLLAYEPWDDVVTMIERNGWRPYTGAAIADFDRLAIELDLVRERGFSIDDEERGRGSYCVGTTIRDRSSRIVAAMSMTGTKQQMTPAHLDELIPALLSAANRVSYRLGNPGSLSY